MRKLLVAVLSGTFLFTGLAVFLAPDRADAIPAFARKHNVDCASCHSAWPLLNASGRKFKESGYKFSESMEKDKNQVVAPGILFDKYFPITILTKSYLYDKQKGKDKVVRPLHEYEIIIGGRAGERLSGFLELEGAYEGDFTPVGELGEVSYHLAPEANILLGFVPSNWADPYESLADWGRRMTRSHKAALDKKYGGADGNHALRHPRQIIALSGRAAGMVFYNVGYGGAADDLTGSDPKTLLGRVAVEFMPGIHVGGFGVSGKADSALINDAATIKEEHKFSRIGLDFQAAFGNALVYGVWLSAKDDPLKSSTSATTTTYSKGSSEKNNGAYVEGVYIVKDGVRPVVVPLLRWESYEEKNGADKYNAVTANVGYYVTSNSKANIEYWSQTKVPSGKSKDNRASLMFTILF
ncbi:MAG: hypothetical protein A2V83_07300 [Nitrospirae bacterium RBG_16_64_22]|nr:MAG: hypothetical protein A2V83_07300 [Nitrospirae bacterium RBG_16_64_22]